MRLSAALKLLAVLIAALAVGLVAASKSVDTNRLKALAAEQVLAATGRTLTVTGAVELRLGLIPKLIANGVSLSNPAGASRPEMVKVERIEAEVALLPLLKREIRIVRLVLVAPDVLLESDRAGRGNWVFPEPMKAEAAKPEADKAETPPGKAPATRFTLREVRVKNGRLAWRDGGAVQTFYLHRLVLRPEANGGGYTAVEVVGNLGTRMLEVGGRLGMPASAGKPWGVHLQGSFDGVQAKAEGTILDPLAGTGIDLALSAQGDEVDKLLHVGRDGQSAALGPFKLAARLSDGRGALALGDLDITAGRRDALVVTARGAVRDLSALSGVELTLSAEADTLAGLSRLTGGEMPHIGPLKATGLLSGGAGHWKLADIKAALAGSDVGGDLALDLTRHPRLSGALTSRVLSLADFTTPASKPGEKLTPKAIKAAGDGRLFPAEPLNLAALRLLDAQVALRAQRLDLGTVHFADTTADLSLANGRLSLRPLRAGLAGGAVEAELALADTAKGAEMIVRATARGIDLGRVLKDAGSDALSGGRTDVRIDLGGHGVSWRALMASLSGETVLNVGDGRLRNTAIDWAGGDLLIQVLGVLNPLSRAEPTTPLSCAVARFTVKDGIATADRGIAVETAKVNVVGAGTVNLRDEHLDLAVTPRARDGLGLSLTTPLAGMTRVRGTLAEPALSLDEVGTARAAASVGAAVATGGLSLVGEALFDRLTGDSAPCRTALGGAPAKPADKKKAGKKGKKNAEPGLLDGLFGR